uniref:DUF4283 domain-containing protein n=1 Tax=Populus alba TaxID=43335 RepID=A0A4U5R1G5_POPAL|nr:hypothetical protein D5086_0000012940 [Populus alba]
MAKNKRKQTSIVRRPHVPAPPSTTGLEINPALDRLDVSPLPVNSSSIGGTNGPISAVQRPHSSSGAGTNGPLLAPPPLPPSSPHDVGPPQLASAMAVASGSKHLDVVLVEDCSDDEILDEDQLDFNFTDEECEDSPQAPAMLPAPHLSSPPPLLPAEQPPLLPKKVMSSAPISEDIQPRFEIWNLCVVGYVSGKNPGFKALQRIIATNWKCEATLTIHETGWLIYHFKSEEDKLAVLRGGPYLVYGRPLVLRQMTKYFDFSSAEMSRVPVWLTSNLGRMSYARVLVEIDLLEELRHNVKISLPEGSTLLQKIIYETLPKYCNFCHVLGHTRLLCSKVAATTSKVPCPQPQPQAGVDKGTVFGRLGPQSPPPPMVQGHPQDNNIQEASEGIPQIFPPTVQGHLNSIQEAPEDTTRPDAALDNSAGWVTVVSRKSSKQQKGKAVAESEPVLTSPAPPSLHACTGAVQTSSQTDPSVTASCVGQVQRPSTTPSAPLDVTYCIAPLEVNYSDGAASSPTRTHIVATTAGDMALVSNPVNVPPVCIGAVQHPPIAPLIVHSCDGEAHSFSPSTTTTSDIVVVGNSVKAPLINAADQYGVRTRNQKQRIRSGREFPSPAKR